MSDDVALRRLEADGLIQREGSHHGTTRRWRAAMARAALHLARSAAEPPQADLRVPIVLALIELYDDEDASDETIARLAEAILPIEAAELDRVTGAGSAEAM